jgi:hypothetical protein
MKSNILSLAFVVLAAGSASAASYIFNNGSSATANGVVDSDGNSFRSGTTVGQALTATGTYGNWTSAGPGVLAVGVFSTDDLSSLGKTSLIAAFTNSFGSGTFGAGPSGQRGTFSLSPAATTITGSAYAGKNMYLFAGNGATFADSTQFLVLKNDTTWLATDDAIPTATTVSFLASNTTVLLGFDLADVRTTNTDSSITAGFQMVPEPSAALLGAVGALGLLRRRRN